MHRRVVRSERVLVVNLHEAKARLSELVERVQGGEEVVIARRGRPAARLVAEHPEPVPLGFLALEVPDAFFEPLPDEELAAWEGQST